MSNFIVIAVILGLPLCTIGSSIADEHRDNKARIIKAAEKAAGKKIRPVSEKDDETPTRIEVNVYRLGMMPVYHAGIVIDGIEYYFNVDNAVHMNEEVRTFEGWTYFRTIRPSVPMGAEELSARFKKVCKYWDGTRYDLTHHNCVFFVQAVLNELQVEGLDNEYMDNSNFRKADLIPGTSSTTELLKLQNGFDDVRIGEALVDDANKLVRMPKDTIRESIKATQDTLATVGKGMSDTGDTISKAGGDVAKEAKSDMSTVVAKSKAAGGKLSAKVKASVDNGVAKSKAIGKKGSSVTKSAGSKVSKAWKKAF